MVGVEFGPNWEKLIKRYQNATDKTTLVGAGIVQWAQAEAVKEAQHNLDTLVYDAPLTASGYERTGATRRAVTRLPLVREAHQTSGTVFVDPAKANRNGFFYPAILNRGMHKHPAYYPRPFWAATVSIMRVRFAREGQVWLAKLKYAFLND